MLNKQYKSKFETLLFTFNNDDKSKVVVDNDPASQAQFSEGLSVCTKSDHSIVKLDDAAAATYKESKFFRIPSIIRTNSGTLIAAYDVRWDSNEDIGIRTYCDQCVAVSRSEDDGQSWSNPYIATSWFYTDEDEKSQSGASDPALMYDDEHDCLFIFSTCGYGVAGGLESTKTAAADSALRCQTSMSYSFDDGKTWSQPISLLKYLTNPEKIVGTYGTTFPGCNNAIKLQHQKVKSNNGKYILPYQLWESKYTQAQALASTRSCLLEITPTYTTVDGVKTVSVACTVLDGIIGGNISGIQNTGASECAVCEDEYGNIIMAVKTYFGSTITDYEYSKKSDSSFIKIYKSTDCGSSWIIVGDVNANNTEEEACKTCSRLRDSIDIKPSICYSEYTHKYYISYIQAVVSSILPTSSSNSDYRRCSVIRCSSDLINWELFDSFSLMKCEYASVIAFDKKIGYIIEGREGPINSEANSFLTYVEYNLVCGLNNIYSNSTNEMITNTDQSLVIISDTTADYVETTTPNDNGTVKKIIFKPSVFTSNDTLSLSSFSLRVRSTVYKLPTQLVSFSLYDSSDEDNPIATTVESKNMGSYMIDRDVLFTFNKEYALTSTSTYYLVPNVTVSLRLIKSTEESQDYYIIDGSDTTYKTLHPVLMINIHEIQNARRNSYKFWMQGFNFKLNAVSDKQKMKISKIGFDLGESYNKTLFAMIYTKNNDETYTLISENGHKAKSKNTLIKGNGYYSCPMFEFEYPITLSRDVMYYVTICENTEASPADYSTGKAGYNTSVAVCDMKCDSDQEIGVNVGDFTTSTTTPMTMFTGAFSGNTLQPRIYVEEYHGNTQFMTIMK